MAKRPTGPVAGYVRHLRVWSGGRQWYFCWRKWRGVAGPVLVPEGEPDDGEVWRDYWERVEMAKMPELPTVEGVKSPTHFEVPKHLAKMPTLADYLLSPAWEGNVAKTGRALMVFPGPTGVRLLLKIGPPPLKLSILAPTWDDSWAALEAVLRSGEAPWEADPNGEPMPKKKLRK